MSSSHVQFHMYIGTDMHNTHLVLKLNNLKISSITQIVLNILNKC